MNGWASLFSDSTKNAHSCLLTLLIFFIIVYGIGYTVTEIFSGMS